MDDTIDVNGGNIYFSILEKNLKKEQAFSKEIDYIKHYKDLKFKVLNKTDGGIGKRGTRHTVESKEKISKIRKNVKIHPRSKKVYVKDITNQEITEFNSAVECSKILPVSYCTITIRCNKKNLKPYKHKYIFSYNSNI